MKRISFLVFLLLPLLTIRAEDSTSNNYVISWCINGNIVSTSTIPIGLPLGELPKLADDVICEGKSFYGWTTETGYSHEIAAPTCIDENTIPSSNTTYHAVFAEKVEETCWQKTDIKDISSTDEIIIVMEVQSSGNNEYYYYALRYDNKETSKLPSSEVKIRNNTLIIDESIAILLSNMTWRFTKSEEGFIVNSMKDASMRLYCTSTDVCVHRRDYNNNNFTIINDYLYNKDRNKYIYGKFNSGIWYWHCQIAKVDTHKILLLKKFDYFYRNFSTTCSSQYTPLAIQIVEWKQDAIIVMYNGDPNESVEIYIDQNRQDEEYSLSNLRKDVAIYEIPISELSSNPGKRLEIIIGDAAKTFDIPIIVYQNNNQDVVLSTSDSIDIIVANGGELSITDIQYINNPIRNITIYGGGKLTIGVGCTLNASTITMRIGSVKNNTYASAYPQLALHGTIGKLSNFHIDYITTYDRYYALSLPYTANTKNIHYPIDIYGENVPLDNTGSFQLQYYDGAARAETGNGWKNLEEPAEGATLKPYQGYTFWGAPKKVSVNNNTKERQKFGIHRIPLEMDINLINQCEIVSKKLSVVAHGNETTMNNDRGWNYLGNPFLSQYSGMSDSLCLQIGLLEKEMIDNQWTGSYIYIGQLRYITQTEDGKTYTSDRVSNAILNPFNTYFIQASQDGELLFNPPSHIDNSSIKQYVPTSISTTEITTGITLSNFNESDYTGLLIAENFTDDYEFNADLSKFENQGLNIYTISHHGKHAYLAINKELATSIPLGYKVQEEGLYTISFDTKRYDIKNIAALYLIDHELGHTKDLLKDDYIFNSDSGTYDHRFELKVEFEEENLSEIAIVEEPDIYIYIESNMLKFKNLQKHSIVHIHDLMGNVIYRCEDVQYDLSIPFEQRFYLIRIEYKGNSKTYKIIIP